MLERIYLEISNICNLQCSFCPVVIREKQVLNPVNFKNILGQAKPLAKQVCLHLMGEPLTHPNFKEVLDISDELSVPIQITTNGVVIENKSKHLFNCKSLRQINFSLQSYKDNFPNRPLEDYLNPIFDFCEKLNELRPEVYINLRLWQQNRNEDIGQEVQEIISLVEDRFKLKINRGIQVENIKSKRIWNKLYLHFDSHFDWPSFNLPFQGTKGTCHALSSHVGIHADGTVVPCCLDKEAQIPLGNCLEQDLKEILKSKRALAMKKGFENNSLVEKLCQHCTYINRFKKKMNTLPQSQEPYTLLN